MSDTGSPTDTELPVIDNPQRRIVGTSRHAATGRVHTMYTRGIAQHRQRFEPGDDAGCAGIARIAMEPGWHRRTGFLKRLFGG